MSGSPFGRSSLGLLQRLRPETVDVADLREVAGALLPALSTGGLRAGIDARSEVVLEEDERTVRVHLADLAADMTDAGVRPTSQGLAAALTAWVDRRPVSDAAALAAGIAVLDWTDVRRTAVAWQVVVRRGEALVPWRPSAGPHGVQGTREAAAARSADVPLELRIEGPVGLWSHSAAPLLATAALVAPERMIARIGSAGLDLADMTVVVTPHRPVAAAGPAVAARLAGETGEACAILPWRRLDDLPWG